MLDTKKEFAQIPLYIVSLKNSSRRDKIEKLLKKYNYSYTLIDAVSGDSLDEELFKKENEKRLKDNARALGKNQIACNLSHKKVWEKMLNEDIKWAMIFEDDVYFYENIQKELSSNLSLLNSDDFYHLGAVGGGRDIFGFKSREIFSYYEKIKFESIEFRLLKDDVIYSAASYLISKDMARKLIAYQNITASIPDNYYAFKKVGIFKNLYITNKIFHPKVYKGQSTLENERKASLTKKESLKAMLRLVVVKIVKLSGLKYVAYTFFYLRKNILKFF